MAGIFYKMEFARPVGRFGLLCAVSFLVAVVALSGCEREKAESRGERPVSHEMRGIVRAAADNGKILIEHEDVQGFMASMTMPFKLRNPGEASGLKPGDGVEFTLGLDEGRAEIHGLRPIDAQSVKLPGASSGSDLESRSVRLKKGDAWPEFSLIDQNGQTIGKSRFQGVYTLVDFMFARCAVSTFCPMMTRNFSEIAGAVAADPSLAGHVRLLSISFDPADTPKVLNEYWTANTGKNEDWIFATGEASQIEQLARAFSVRFEANKGTYDHTLCTSLIDPEGRVIEFWRGNGWKPAEIVDALKGLLDSGANPSAFNDFNTNQTNNSKTQP